MPVKRGKGRAGRKGKGRGKKGGKKKGKKGKRKSGKLPPIEYANAEAQVDLMAERRKWILENNKREIEMRENKQHQYLQQKTEELQQLTKKREDIEQRCQEMEGKEEEIKTLSHIQKAQTLERNRKTEQLEAIEAELREENRLLSENIFKQTEELLQPEEKIFEGACDTCDPYIKETVAMYFDLLYKEWAGTSLAMVILKSWEEKRRVLEKEKKIIEKTCMFKSTGLQADFERELKYLQTVVSRQDQDNTEIVVQSAKTLHAIEHMQTQIATMRDNITSMFTSEQYANKAKREECQIHNLKTLIAQATERAQQLQTELEESREAEQLEDDLIRIRKENRLCRDVIKDMEEKYREMVEKWRHNENVYRTVSHNFKFDFLPRLAAEREDLKQKVERFKEEQDDVTQETDQISREIAKIEQDNKELRLRVEELTFDQRCLKTQISKQDETLSEKQTQLNKYHAEIRAASEAQASLGKQMKLLRTVKDRTEKKLKWSLNEMKEAKNVFTVAESRMTECYAAVSEKVDRIRNFQKDLSACILEDNFDLFIEKFTNIINSYAAINVK